MKKTFQFTVALLLAIVSLAFQTISYPATVKAAGVGGCNDIPSGFVTAGISITDLSTGGSGGGVATSSYPEYSSMDYTENGDVYIEVTGGGNNQQDTPVDFQVSGFNSNEGGFIGGTSYGYNVPSYSGTYHNFTADTITVIATQCPGDTAVFTLRMNPVAQTPDFSLSCSPSTQTITAGGTTSFNLSTTAANGFASPVTFSSSISPSTAVPPTVSFTNNGATPSATTTAVINTVETTTANTYTLTFTGTGGGQSHQCQTDLVVNAAPGNFHIDVTPDLTNVTKTSGSKNFNVTISCVGSFAGPVTELSASSPYTGLSYNFSSTTANCGQTVTLTVGNLSSVPQNQLSTPQERKGQIITVRGRGN